MANNDDKRADADVVDEASGQAGGTDWLDPANASETVRPPKAKKHHNRKRIAIGWTVVAAVVVVAVCGLLAWHNTPGFCTAICHDPMDPYLPTYEAKMGQPAHDKWGNDVDDASGMLASVHQTAGKGCLDCHNPVISEQMGEATEWLSGNYESPLTERDSTQLLAGQGVEDVNSDQFCMNDGCHDVTREDLAKETEWMGVINPHVNQHGAQKCTTCHKAHRASVMYCTQCHTEAVVPDGWISYQESQELVDQQAQPAEAPGANGFAGVTDVSNPDDIHVIAEDDPEKVADQRLLELSKTES